MGLNRNWLKFWFCAITIRMPDYLEDFYKWHQFDLLGDFFQAFVYCIPVLLQIKNLLGHLNLLVIIYLNVKKRKESLWLAAFFLHPNLLSIFLFGNDILCFLKIIFFINYCQIFSLFFVFLRTSNFFLQNYENED